MSPCVWIANIASNIAHARRNLMPRQTSLQLTEATERQVEYLKQQGFGTFTDINRVAIDRMYNQVQGGEPRMIILGCMPMMADIVSGAVPRPVELPDGGDVNWYVATPDGDIYWPDVAPAWRELGLGDVADVCLVARQGREPRDGFCESVVNAVRELRDFLGEQGTAVCHHGRVLVFNADGTRVAIMER
jgi:hypothetical protein